MFKRKRAIKYGIVDVFSDTPFCGNPAGIVFNADSLNNDEMQKIAKEINVANTAFLLQPENGGNLKIRYFCPDSEINMCGHSTIGSIFARSENNQKDVSKNTNPTIKIETKVGTLTAKIKRRNGNIARVGVTLPKPEFYAAIISKKRLFNALNIDQSAVVGAYPIEIVNSGLYFMEVGIKDRENLLKIKPDFRKLQKITEEMNIDSIQVFTRDTFEKSSTVLSRTFFPKYGVNEDPVCGTGNAAIASYLIHNNIEKSNKEKIKFIGEQGHSVSRPGKVYMEVTCKNDKVEKVLISGTAVLVCEGNIYLN